MLEAVCVGGWEGGVGWGGGADEEVRWRRAGVPLGRGAGAPCFARWCLSSWAREV